jgi:hypothetical protein
MTAVPRPATGAAALALALVLAGCSLSVGDEDDPTPTDTGGSAAQPDGGPTGERTSTAAGPGPEELSAELLERARAADRRPAVGSVSGEVEGESVTMEVVSVRRTSDAVLAELRLSSDAPEVRIGVTTFNSPPLESISFVRGLTLDDEAGGTRYRPLVFDDGRDGCVCPYLPLVLGPQAQTLQAMYPPLPESVTTVTVNLGDVLVVPDVEIEDAPGTDG